MAHVHIYVPAFGLQIAAATTRSLVHLAGHLFAKGIGATFSTYSHPDIEEHRNMALTLWYDAMPQSTHLLFIDADMGFQPELISDMLMFDQPVVGVVYPKKTLPREWVVCGFGNHQPVEARGGFLKVAGVGAGVMLIRRDAVTKLIEAYPEHVDTRIDLLPIKPFLPKDGTRLLRLFDKFDDPALGKISEDLSFCRRWVDLGGEVWANIAHTLEHVGQHSFAGSYAAEASRGAQGATQFPVKRCKRGVFKYNANDTFIGKSLDVYGEWCDYELDLLKEVIGPGSIVLDVGANIGTHTVAFSQMVGEGGEVYAFEAQPRLFNLFCDNIKLNNLANVKGVCGVVGDRKADRVRLAALPPDDQAFNFGSVAAEGDGPDYAVADMIDSLGLDRCGLIKIDVEGTEAAVIRGARATIARCQPVLYVENNGPGSTALWEALQEIGYKGFWHIGPYFNPDNHFGNPVDVWPNVMPSVNVIAVPVKEMTEFGLPSLLGPHDHWRDAMARSAQLAAE